MKIMELLEQLITFIANGGRDGQSSSGVERETIETTNNQRKKYEEDIEALSVFFSLESGSEIEVSLQDILAICPRSRRRSDAYQGLIGELGRRGVRLTIKTRTK